MKKLLFFVWVILISTSCEKNYIENSTIAGVWVEASHNRNKKWLFIAEILFWFLLV